MKFIFGLLPVIILAGCSLPKNEQDLVGVDRAEVFCHKQDLEESIKKIYPRLAKCYNRSSTVPVVINTSSMSGTLSTITTGEKVVEKKDNNGNPIFIVVSTSRGNPDYYGLRIQAEEGEAENCQTKFTFHTMNFAWDRHASRIKKWLIDPQAGCQIW